jgi:hypothetical protein
MRDWKSDEAYAFCRSLSAAGWAWEFLRRNPAYISDFQEVTSARSSKKRELNAAGGHPTLKKIGTDFDDPLKDLPSLSRAGKLWGIDGQIHDPNCDEAPSFLRVFPMEVTWREALSLFRQPSPEVDEVVIRPDVVLIAFDLSMGNDALDAVKVILDRARRKRAGQRRRARKVHPASFETYLRLLDAERASASNDEIVRTLRVYSIRDNDAGDSYAASKALARNLNEARSLQESPLTLLAVGPLPE